MSIFSFILKRTKSLRVARPRRMYQESRFVWEMPLRVVRSKKDIDNVPSTTAAAVETPRDTAHKISNSFSKKLAQTSIVILILLLN